MEFFGIYIHYCSIELYFLFLLLIVLDIVCVLVLFA